MLTLQADELNFDFSDLHPAARVSVSFYRTLRVPDDGCEYPLPPGLGEFPLRHVDDYAERIAPHTLQRGGLMLPMYQAEAMWLLFLPGYGPPTYPFALKVAAGKINAVSGEAWTQQLTADPQDYVVIPAQPWLDGFRIGNGRVGQFVAMPLGANYSVEEQLTGKGAWGGVQIIAYPMKPERYKQLRRAWEDEQKAREKERSTFAGLREGLCDCEPMFQYRDMGLGRGGMIRQKIAEDEYGIDAWDQTRSHRCFVTILNSARWLDVTGTPPPTLPPTAVAYTKAGLPWFDYYDDKLDLAVPAKVLGGVKSVATIAAENGQETFDFGESVGPSLIVGLKPHKPRPVREYDRAE